MNHDPKEWLSDLDGEWSVLLVVVKVCGEVTYLTSLGGPVRVGLFSMSGVRRSIPPLSDAGRHVPVPGRRNISLYEEDRICL